MMPCKHTEKIPRSVAETFGQANDPHSPKNKDDQDFQAGYKVGIKNEDIPLLQVNHPLWIESEKRGLALTESDAAFDRWKQGYWSGRYVGFMQEVLETPDP